MIAKAKPSFAHKPICEPYLQGLERNFPCRDIDHKIINRGVIWYGQPISAAHYKQFHQQPRSPLVPIHKSMICNHAMQHCCSLACERAMVAAIGATQPGLDQMQTYDAVAPPECQRCIMRFDRVRKREAVVAFTD